MNAILVGIAIGIGILAFCTSIVWYSPLLFGDIWKQGADASLENSAGWKFAVMPLREILTAMTMLFILFRMKRLSPLEAVTVSIVLWLGFYGVQLAGAVVWDGMSPALGAVHAVDWLMKLLIITVCMSAALNKFGRTAPVPGAE